MNELMLIDVIGSSGKKPPAQHIPVEYPDTGSSTQVAKLLIVLSEGEIEGFTASDVYLKQVPATEYSVDVTSRNGTTYQDSISGFAEVYVPLTATSSEIKYGDSIGNHAIIAVPIIQDAVVLTQAINALFKVQDNGDTTVNTVSLDYYTSNGVIYTFQKTKTITAKYSSGYAFSVTLNRPDNVIGDVWYAKIVRTTPNSISNKDSKTTSFSQAIGIVYKNLPYHRKALLGLVLKDAKQFGGSLPEILVRAKGIKVDVPANYNPATKEYSTTGIGTYAGAWDGTFSTLRQYTDNPVWCLLHCLTDSYIGLNLPYDEIDIFSFYELAKYCDETVLVENVSVSISEIPNATATFTRNGGTFYINNTVTPTASHYIIYGKLETFVGLDGDVLSSFNVQQGSTSTISIDIGSYLYFRVEAAIQAEAGTTSSISTEPRYSLNAQFITRENLNTFLMYFLSLMNANWTTNEFGQLSLMWERQGQPVTKQVTNATVVDGLFNYSSTDIEQRFNHVNVTFSDPEAFGRTNTISVPEVDSSGVGLTSIDRAAIASQSRYGFQQLDLVLVGCTSKAQAYRKGRFSLYTSVFQYNIIDFKVLLEGMVFFVGEIISVCDNFNQEDLISGIILDKILDGLGNITIKFDRDIVLENIEYQLTYILQDGVTQETVIFTPEAGTVTEFSYTLSSDTHEPLLSSFILHKTSIKPKLYKIIKITQEEQTYSIVAVEHHETAMEGHTLTKYEYIDNIVTIRKPTGDFSNIQYEAISPIVDNSISVTPRYSIDSVTNNLVRSLEVTWQAPNNPISIDGKIENRIFSYSIGITRPKATSGIETQITPTTSYTVENAEFGDYIFSVAILDTTNNRSSAIKTLKYSFTTDGTSTLLPPVDLFIKDTTEVNFYTSDVTISWGYNPDNNNVSDTLFAYSIRYLRTDGTVLQDFTTIPLDKITKGGSITVGYSLAKSLGINPPRDIKLEVYSIDALGRLSSAEVKTFSKVEPPAPSFTYIDNGNSITFTITNITGYGVSQYKIYASDTSGFTPSDTTLVKTVNLDPAIEPAAYSVSDIAYPTWATKGSVIYFKVESLDGYV